MYRDNGFEKTKISKQASASLWQICSAPQAVAGQGNGNASAEAVARALGYTEKEQALALEVLKSFEWRPVAATPVELPAGSVKARAEETGAPEDEVEAAS